MLLTKAGFLTVVFAVAALAGTDTGLMALIPSGTKVISSVDVEKARSSPFGQFLLSQMNRNDQGVQTLSEQTGFDPRRDLQYMVFAASGPNGTDQSFVLLLRGNFDQTRITALAESKGVTTLSVDGIPVYINGKQTNQVGFTFPEVGVAAVGSVPALEQVIHNRANPSTLDSQLQQLSAQASAQGDAWFASLVPGALFSNQVNPGVPAAASGAQALKSVRASSGAVQFGTNLHFSFEAVTRSEKDAAALSDVLRFLANTVTSQQEPRARILAPAVNAMTLLTSGNEVHASVDIPEQSAEELAQLGPPHGRRTR